jgi:hypothetical protein
LASNGNRGYQVRRTGAIPVKAALLFTDCLADFIALAA